MPHGRQNPSSRPQPRLDSRGPGRHAVTVSRTDVERLAHGIIAARERLGLSQDEFAGRAGIALKTVQRIELGLVAPRARTFAGLDRGAGWAPGSARALFEHGTTPTPADTDEDPEPDATPTRDTPDTDPRKRALRRLFELVPEIRAGYGDDAANALFDKALELARGESVSDAETGTDSQPRAL